MNAPITEIVLLTKLSQLSNDINEYPVSYQREGLSAHAAKSYQNPEEQEGEGSAEQERCRVAWRMEIRGL